METPTWGVLAERYGRCLGRLVFYVAHRVRDPETADRIAIEALARSHGLLLVERDELEELRRLRESAAGLIATYGGVAPASHGAAASPDDAVP